MLSRTCLPPYPKTVYGVAGDGAAHQVRQEAVQLRAGVVRAGEAPAAEADGRHVEVAAVLLDEQVGRGLGDAEQRVEAAVDGHRGRDPVVVLVVLRQLEARLELDERQEVRPVAVDLVGRA